MAGDWTPFETSTLRKPEVLQIAATTGRSRHEVIGLLVEFWAWAGEQTVDGNVDVCVDALASHVCADVEFWRALIAVGWLRETPTGIHVPNADKWLSKAAKARLAKTSRQKRWRAKANNVGACVDGSVDAHVDALPSTTEEKRREENTTTTPPTPPGGFELFWSTWPKHPRKASKSKCLKVWRKKRLEGQAEHIVAVVRAMAQSPQWTREGGAYIPAPLVWLNQERWDGDFADIASRPPPTQPTPLEVWGGKRAAALIRENQERQERQERNGQPPANPAK